MLFLFDHAIEIAAMAAANFLCIALLSLTLAQRSSSHEPAAASAIFTAMYAICLMYGSDGTNSEQGRSSSSRLSTTFFELPAVQLVFFTVMATVIILPYRQSILFIRRSQFHTCSPAPVAVVRR